MYSFKPALLLAVLAAAAPSLAYTFEARDVDTFDSGLYARSYDDYLDGIYAREADADDHLLDIYHQKREAWDNYLSTRDLYDSILEARTKDHSGLPDKHSTLAKDTMKQNAHYAGARQYQAAGNYNQQDAYENAAMHYGDQASARARSGQDQARGRPKAPSPRRS